MTPVTDHLSTDPNRDLSTLLRLAGLSPGAVMVIEIFSLKRDDPARIRRGEWVHAFWKAMLNRAPGVLGHRLLWDQLLFICPNSPLESAAKVASEIAQELSHSDQSSVCAIAAAPGGEPALITIIDKLHDAISNAVHGDPIPDGCQCFLNGRPLTNGAA